jgi:transcriptional regulator with XRE-family HTH domain
MGIVDDQRIGRALRVLRRRRGMRQADVAAIAKVSRSLVSLVERGHLGSVTVKTIRSLFAAVDAGFEGQVLWRGGAIDRLLDEAHADVVAATVTVLRRSGWRCFVETTYSVWGERGSIDILAVHEGASAALVVEVKSELQALDATVRKIDEKSRLASRGLVHERVGWQPKFVGRLLVLPATDAARRRVSSGAPGPVLAVAFPARGALVRTWIREPSGAMAGILFLSIANPGSITRGRGGPERVRQPKSGRSTRVTNSPTDRADPRAAETAR